MVAMAMTAAVMTAMAAVLMAVALDNGGCGGSYGCGGVMTADVTAGVKKQQSTSDGSFEGGRWTQARRRVTNNNESAWPMMRAVTKRAVRAMAMVTRVADERRQQR